MQLTRSLRNVGARYVEKVRLLDYWKVNDEVLAREFPRSRFVLMVDKRPLIYRNRPSPELAVFDYPDLRKRLGDYGVTFDLRHSCLLDAVPTNDDMFTPLFGVAVTTEDPPEDSPIQKNDVIRELGNCLEGKFIEMRIAMLTMNCERQRCLLATFQSLSRWSRIYLRCPKCAAALKMRVSKSGAACNSCKRVYYPTFSPVAITLIRDPTDQHCLLVRHKGSANGIFTCVAGFASTGETMNDCARREIAEEVGIDVISITSLGMSQPWPMPDSSLMLAFEAVANMSDPIDTSPDELETAQWFTREQVREALTRTIEDPTLKGLPKSIEERQVFRYIPPLGAIAHQIIRNWVERV
ncbi:unnamed protein product [Auanema sp. JU1783]|nr:unnamed protein product [Auanema sp. JU1783]